MSNTDKPKCETCGGSGEVPCDNPDHGFIEAIPGDISRIGCPACGHSLKIPCPACTPDPKPKIECSNCDKTMTCSAMRQMDRNSPCFYAEDTAKKGHDRIHMPKMTLYSPDTGKAEGAERELKYCKEHRTIHCSCQTRRIEQLEAELRLQTENLEQSEEEKLRLEAEIEQLKEQVALFQKICEINKFDEVQAENKQLKADLKAKSAALELVDTYIHTLSTESLATRFRKIEAIIKPALGLEEAKGK